MSDTSVTNQLNQIRNQINDLSSDVSSLELKLLETLEDQEKLLALLEQIYISVHMGLGTHSDTFIMEKTWDICNNIIEDEDNMGFHKRIQKTLAENNWDHFV